MVYYVIKLGENIYWCHQGPYGEYNCSKTPGGAQRFIKRKWAKSLIHVKGLSGATIERIEVPDGR